MPKNNNPQKRNNARWIANELAELRRLQKASHIAPRLPYSSVPEGNLVVTDSEGNVVDVVGSKPKDGQIILPGTPPSKPSAPVVVATLGTVQASWDGLFVEEYVAPDMAHLEVHGSTEGEEFEPTSATLLGTITNLSGGTLTAGLEYGTWFFKFVAVTTSGSKSVPSDASSCEVIPLVEAPDMVEVLADIDARYDGVITEAGQLGARLDQAALDLAAHEQRLADAEANLINLNDVELVQLQASVDQAKLDLAQAQTDVANALAGLQLTEADLANLKNVALPALQDTVTDAENRLTTAEGEIVTSKNRLAEAESDLTEAFGQISAVDSKATTAITNASTAQSTADTAKTDAATAAGIAGGKADVLIQSTAPATAMRKATTLWIDTTSGANTPKRWNGSAWVEVTDKAAKDAATAAANAQSKAQEALTAAGSAQTTADSALTMAGSKTKAFYSTSTPSGTGTNVNDIWRRIDASKNVIGEWYWTGTVWQATQITNEMISNLDVGKLTAGSAIIQTAVINKIAAQTATVIELNADRITAGTLAAERLNVTDLAARIATVIQLNADRITSGTIATGRLNATEVAAAVANVIQLNASRITAGTINTARLNTAEIAAAVATIIQLNADRITAGVINTDRLNVNEIAARSASFQTVDVKNLFVTTGTMQEAVINKLWTDVVLSKKITAEMIAVGDFQNYATINPSMNLNVSIPTKWSTVTDGNYTRTAPTSENYLMFKNMDGPVPFQAGDKLRISFDALADSADATYSGRVWFYNSSGSYLTGFDASFSDTTITSTEKRFTGNLEIPSIPATASQYLIGISGTNIKTVKVRNVRAIRMTAGELIVDGTITATKIAANAIEADKLAANSVTSDKILAGSIKAQHIEAKSISTDKLAIGSFDNILPDPDNLLDSWIDPSASSPAVARWQFTSSEARPERSKNYQQINVGSEGNTQGTVYFGYNREMIPVEPGQSFTGYAWMRNNKTINTEYNYASLRFYFYDKAGALISGSGGNQNGGSNSALSGVWTRVGGIPVTAPTEAVGMRIRPTVYFSNHVANGEIFFCGAMSVFRAASGELIVDGAIDGKTITGALIQTDKDANKGIKLKNEGLEVYSPEGEKTLSITAGQGVDFVGIWGHKDAVIDEATGAISYPAGVEPEQVASLSANGEIAGNTLSVAEMGTFDGNITMDGEPLADSHLGRDAPGEFGPVMSGRSLLGTTFKNFVDRHPQVDDATSWLTPLSHGFVSNAYFNTGGNGAGGLSADGRWVWSGLSGGLVDRMLIQDTVEIVNNRGYLITYNMPSVRETTSGTGTVGACVLRYAVDGALGVNTDNVIQNSRCYIAGGAYDNPGRTIFVVGGQDIPAGSVTIGLQAYVYEGRRMETTDTADARYFNISVLDIGLATKGNTGKGVDLYRKLPTATAPEETTPKPPVTPPKPKQYTNTWNASWWGTWWVGNGNGTNSYFDSKGKVTQGRPPGVGVNQRGLIGFPNMTSTLSGSTIKKVEVYVYAAHWYSSSGGTLRIATHGSTSKPSTVSSNPTVIKTQSLAKPEGRWITLPSSVHAGVLSGSVRGIHIYNASTGYSGYGYLTGSKSKIRVTYVK
ncbi:hypothetical protein [Glutamicibacter sp. TV12E]|uniref:hypothetical protein n=1 Tax=Glutamicibacter sp. TV12E TaxID=3446362 RepID=UPI004034F383